MIHLPKGQRVWARAHPTDLRKGFAGLAGLVQREMGHDLIRGDLFLFLSRSRRLVKILQWDGSGLCIYSKRLAKGRFVHLWKNGTGGTIQINNAELSQLLEGVDLTRDGRWRK